MVHPWVLIYISLFFTFICLKSVSGLYQDVFIAHRIYQAYQMKKEQENMDKRVELYKRTLKLKLATNKQRNAKKVVGVKIIRPPSERPNQYNDLLSTIWLGGVPFQDPLMNKNLYAPKEKNRKRRYFVLQYLSGKNKWVKLSNFVLVDFYIYTLCTFSQIDLQRRELLKLAAEYPNLMLRTCNRGNDILCAENTFSSQILIKIANRKASFLVNLGSGSCPYALSYIINEAVDFEPKDESPDKSVVDDMVKIYVPLANRDLLTPSRKDRSYLPLENVISDFQWPPMIVFSTSIVILANIATKRLGYAKTNL